MQDPKIYATVLLDSLQKKFEVLKELLELTRKQNQLLSVQKIVELDTDSFDRIVDQKAEMIEKLDELDKGFETIYERAGAYIAKNKYEFQSQIIQMQNHIRTITDISLQIQGLEAQNKSRFNLFLKEKRNEITNFKTSNKVAVSYYQNMANQHREWQSHFLDKRK
ncbi:flagellar protein FlgN [Eubacterium sp. MSJ-13]|uniref:flagellar export chaperone FlgN n=1 Tax=Eubacterium sp. MSJ-13 TaxID=2841513 RepID=UPI001C0F9465|nr:flagellar export chaperone FlgN [Eubacterium sp. MSJ-13]MBU5477769.1 flagellar protein FlgN [Eubacterium sp. MSJ-13]